MAKFTLKSFLGYSLAIILLTSFALLAWVLYLDHQIQSRLSSGWFKPPVELYSAPDRILLKQKNPPETLLKQLDNWHYRKRSENEVVRSGDYALLDADTCAEVSGTPFMEDTSQCVLVHHPNELGVQLIGLNFNDEVVRLYTGSPLHEVEEIEFPAKLFAQFYEGTPLLRKYAKIGDIPLQCLQAVTAVEDANFLDHSGVSFTGVLRAILRNIIAGRYAQGGSTITQQLVKNYFLTAERSLKRKAIEALMALILEARTSKDEIIEAYLSIVYMGQNGPFQIIGFHAASEHFFNKPLSKLNLPECALLAAVINSPGRYNPFKHPEAAAKRRTFVLQRMQEVGVLSQLQVVESENAPLPSEQKSVLGEPAPYFTQAVFRELADLGLDTTNGLRVYTSLSERAQESAQSLIREHVNKLETGFLSLKEKKEAGKMLEAAMIAVDVKSGSVSALVGGRSYRSTQFNRILDGNRQVGSIMKPFVYLAALEGVDFEGNPYTPLTEVLDEPFTYEYEGQSWSPKNYGDVYMGKIPLFVGLKNSLNVATAKTGLNIGVENIIGVARRAGIESEMQALPSLTLGAFEIRPWEIAESYATLARLGIHKKLYSVIAVEELNGNRIYEHEDNEERRFTEEVVARLVGMMKQTVETGTARRTRYAGFQYPAAGKTGTTSDTRDAWFAGFTPNVLAVSWVGYDDNTSSGLTGASGALPIWIDFMKTYAVEFPADDFPWPDTVRVKTIGASEMLELCPNCKEHELVDTEIIE